MQRQVYIAKFAKGNNLYLSLKIAKILIKQKKFINVAALNRYGGAKKTAQYILGLNHCLFYFSWNSTQV